MWYYGEGHGQKSGHEDAWQPCYLEQVTDCLQPRINKLLCLFFFEFTSSTILVYRVQFCMSIRPSVAVLCDKSKKNAALFSCRSKDVCEEIQGNFPAGKV
jgi:hypothetical protein